MAENNNALKQTPTVPETPAAPETPTAPETPAAPVFDPRLEDDTLLAGVPISKDRPIVFPARCVCCTKPTSHTDMRNVYLDGVNCKYEVPLCEECVDKRNKLKNATYDSINKSEPRAWLILIGISLAVALVSSLLVTLILKNTLLASVISMVLSIVAIAIVSKKKRVKMLSAIGNVYADSDSLPFVDVKKTL